MTSLSLGTLVSILSIIYMELQKSCYLLPAQMLLIADMWWQPEIFFFQEEKKKRLTDNNLFSVNFCSNMSMEDSL